jgi:hypothetical protein
MWTKLSDVTKIEEGDRILKHPSGGGTIVGQPTGQETNSDLYEVISKTFDGITLKWLANAIIASMNLENTTRQVTASDLLNGEWWTEDNG